jgi:hypothetical protein
LLEPLGALAAQVTAPVLDAQVGNLLPQPVAVLDVDLRHAGVALAGDVAAQRVLELCPPVGLVVPDPAWQCGKQVGLGLGLGLGERASAVEPLMSPNPRAEGESALPVPAERGGDPPAR